MALPGRSEAPSPSCGGWCGRPVSPPGLWVAHVLLTALETLSGALVEGAALRAAWPVEAFERLPGGLGQHGGARCLSLMWSDSFAGSRSDLDAGMS